MGCASRCGWMLCCTQPVSETTALQLIVGFSVVQGSVDQARAGSSDACAAQAARHRYTTRRSTQPKRSTLPPWSEWAGEGTGAQAITYGGWRQTAGSTNVRASLLHPLRMYLERDAPRTGFANLNSCSKSHPPPAIQLVFCAGGCLGCPVLYIFLALCCNPFRLCNNSHNITAAEPIPCSQLWQPDFTAPCLPLANG